MAANHTEDSGKRDWRDSLAAVVAVCGLLVFLILVILMFAQRGGSETAWDRLVYLLTGVEAVAFAGAGWVFGKEVHRGEVARAENQVKTEKQRADQAQEDARDANATAQAERLRGARIAQAVETASAQASAQIRQPTRRGGETDVSASIAGANVLDSVADLARRLYPEFYTGE